MQVSTSQTHALCPHPHPQSLSHTDILSLALSPSVHRSLSPAHARVSRGCSTKKDFSSIPRCASVFSKQTSGTSFARPADERKFLRSVYCIAVASTRCVCVTLCVCDTVCTSSDGCVNFYRLYRSYRYRSWIIHYCCPPLSSHSIDKSTLLKHSLT